MKPLATSLYCPNDCDKPKTSVADILTSVQPMSIEDVMQEIADQEWSIGINTHIDWSDVLSDIDLDTPTMPLCAYDIHKFIHNIFNYKSDKNEQR